ncbi:MAG TPA: guanylate kinase, partial [candidate division WOR-3 bacterium]|nr:guanylate kinase [candidate division WOR-3 bacterium]
MNHEPFLIVVSAPSGTGKTTVLRRFLKICDGLFYSVSATTRKMRPGEVNGRDYIFLDKEVFENWIKEGKLLEWAEVYGEYYGTPRDPVIENMELGRDVIMDLDVEGKRKLEAQFPDRLVSVFLYPPDRETLRKRLLSRGAEDEEKLKIRLSKAEEELRWASEYEYWVVNED